MYHGEYDREENACVVSRRVSVSVSASVAGCSAATDHVCDHVSCAGTRRMAVPAASTRCCFNTTATWRLSRLPRHLLRVAGPPLHLPSTLRSAPAQHSRDLARRRHRLPRWWLATKKPSPFHPPVPLMVRGMLWGVATAAGGVYLSREILRIHRKLWGLWMTLRMRHRVVVMGARSAEPIP